MATKDSFLVVGLGEILWDIYPMRRCPGGAPANAAVHACRLGARSAIVSGVGDDEAGRSLFQTGKARGLDVTGIQTVKGFATGTVGVTLDDAGVPCFKCSKDTAFDHMKWNEHASNLAKTADAVLVGTLAQRSADSREFIQKFLASADHAVIVFDANFREWTPRIHAIVQSTCEIANVLKVNENELRMLRQIWSSDSTDEIFLMSLVDRLGLAIAALTLGPRGSIITDGDTLVREPGFDVAVADTTGCGDAFTAVLTLGILQNWPLASIARCANAYAAFNATETGAVPSVASEKVVGFMNAHNIDWYF
ncbi:carbohydrate kinase [bacterium]|nr:carbohydrate kinase [bacterium]